MRGDAELHAAKPALEAGVQNAPTSPLVVVAEHHTPRTPNPAARGILITAGFGVLAPKKPAG